MNGVGSLTRELGCAREPVRQARQAGVKETPMCDGGDC
jgi:hypothetical protein